MLKKMFAYLFAGSLFSLIFGLYGIASAADQSVEFDYNRVPNSSLEISTDDQSGPIAWQQSSWGDNKARFSYLRNGHSGRRSVRVDMSRYSTGDAKWYYDLQPLEPGVTYQFSDFYRSNTSTRVVLMIQHQDGSISYQELKRAPSSLRWTSYKDVFTAPADISALSVMHLISAAGFLITDDYSVKRYQPVGFDRPLISLTFDDSWEDNYSSALPIMNQYGFRSTQYYSTANIQSKPDEQFKVAEFVKSGHEIGSHGVSHTDLTTLSSVALARELRDSKAYLETFAGTGNVKSFATPYGGYNAKAITAILRYYQSNRNVDVGFNTQDGLVASNVRVENVVATTTMAEYNSWIDQSARDHTWLVLVYHRVASDPGQYDTSSGNFALQMQSVKNSGIAVKSVSGALAELLPQI